MSAAEYYELKRLIEEVREIAVEAQARADRALTALLARASTGAAKSWGKEIPADDIIMTISPDGPTNSPHHPNSRALLPKDHKGR